MTSLMDEAVRSLRQDIPPEQQDDMARLVMQLTGRERSPHTLTPSEEADIEASEAAAVRNDFASDEEVRAIWSKHGL